MSTNDSFETLKLDTPLSSTTIQSIKDLGFVKPTPVQSLCIPLILSRKDVVAEAVTGSGKTLAFLVPVVEMLLRRGEELKASDIGALVLTPTRELGQQISEVLKPLTEPTNLSQALFVGGSGNIEGSIQLFNKHGGHIVVATPGRFLAMLQPAGSNAGTSLAKSLKALEILILDEADRLLSNSSMTMEINSILSYLPKQRRTSLFSATQTDSVEAFIRAGLRNPVQVVVREKSKTVGNNKGITRTPDSLNIYFTISDGDKKLGHLLHLLRSNRTDKNIVFFNTCACVDYFSKLLTELLKNIPVLAMHGQMKMKRNEVFKKFQDMSHGVLVCSDVMARGIDIPKVSWVIQYDPPSNAEVFVHRCGRTARMGNVGNAIVFLLPNEDTYVDFISANQKIQLAEYAFSDDIVSMKKKIQKLARNDRELYEKGLRAFVSFIQSYRKHECNITFQIKELDICNLADGFGLVHLPKMPEVTPDHVSTFVALDLDTDKIRYLDKTREKQRQLKLEERRKAAKMEKNKAKEHFKKSASWSLQKQKRERKKEKQKARKRKSEPMSNSVEEIDDLLKEGRLLKKLKKGKIDEEEFEKQTGGENLDMEDGDRGEVT